MSCLNPRDSMTARIFTVDGAFHTLNANSGGGMMRHGILQPIPAFSPFRARSFMENVRCEMRLVSLHGEVAGALPAQPGGKQINVILQEAMPS